MRATVFACITLVGAVALPTIGYAVQPVSARASNIAPQDTHSIIAPALPAPPLPDNSPPSAFLSAAQQALAHGQTGEAQEALERAEARALDRAVPAFQADKSVQDPLVTLIEQARMALAANDIDRANQLIASASDMAAYLASAQ